mgnify:CR=1 FL=1
MTWWWQWQSFFSLATPLRSDEADFILCSEMAHGLAPGTLLSTLSLIANQAQLKYPPRSQYGSCHRESAYILINHQGAKVAQQCLSAILTVGKLPFE